MNLLSSAAFSLTVLSPAAFAASGADLVTTLDGPTSVMVYETGEYNVVVDNNGNRNASDVEVVIQLPETNTSPTVHVMGIVDAWSSACAPSGTTLVCDLGRIRKGKSKSVWFDLALPEADQVLSIDATASSSTQERNPGDESDSITPILDNYDVALTTPQALFNSHCTGQGLTSFYECALHPSSITSHSITLNTDGSVELGVPGYTGSWSQGAPDQLAFTYSYNGQVVADFEGFGVSSSCFEGLTLFPNSSWVSPYEVCLD